MKRLYTLKELAEKTASKLVGDPTHEVCGVGCIEKAKKADVSFLANPRYLHLLPKTCAGAVCVGPEIELDSRTNYLVSEDPSKTFEAVTKLLISDYETAFKGIHSQAVIHETAHIDKTATIGPNVTIDAGVVIEANVTIYANCYIGPFVTIGSGSIIYPNVTIREHCKLGKRIVLQPGVVIGSCGFGYHTDELGNHKKIDQLGTVVLEDDVEIGANTTVDRARFNSTIIKKGSKIDNLVQIGHNVELGEHNLIVAQSGIAGSTKTGNYVVVGAQTGITGHIEIIDNCKIAAKSGVSKSLKKSGDYGGVPAVEFSQFNAHRVHVKRLPKYAEELKKLKHILLELEERVKSDQ